MDATVFPLSPPPKREFMYNQTYKHNSMDVSDFAMKTREISLISSTRPAREMSSLKNSDIARAQPKMT